MGRDTDIKINKNLGFAAIAPGTTVRLIQNAPVDSDYRFSLNFDGLAQQQSYFLGLNGLTLEGLTYQKTQNKIRVDKVADTLMSYNYLMFRNPVQYGDRWFYAFIVDIEYITDNTTYVTFEMDWYQTYLFDFRLGMSFVEREHSIDDVIGDNIVKEGLDLGHYVYRNASIPDFFSSYAIIVAATFDKELKPFAGGMYGGVYSGVCYNVFDTASEVNAFLDEVTRANKPSGIVSVFMQPRIFCYGWNTPTPSEVIRVYEKSYTDIDGYIPKNNKLFTYPYNMLYVTNGEGNSCNLPYEFFGTNSCSFAFFGSMCCNPDMFVVPLSFRGSGNQPNFSQKLTLASFPQCSYNVDTYKAYVAQNSMRLGVSAVSDVGKIAVGAVTGATNPVGLALLGSGLDGIMNTLATAADISTMPPQAHGANSSNADMAEQIKGFWFYNVCIKNDYARIIDEFFNVYGYQTNLTKIPNTNSRPHWNYVKTKGCNVLGAAPANVRSRIAQIFDNGITLWQKGSEVGNYTLDNRP